MRSRTNMPNMPGARTALVTVVIVTLVASGLFALLWTQQRRLIYFPSPGPVPPASMILPGAQDVVLETADGLRLGAWYAPARRGHLPLAGEDPHSAAAPAVLVFNGNAGDRSARAPLAAALHHAGLAVLLLDYRGYGGNPGPPTEDGLADDARAARDWLAARPDVDPNRIVYFGESLGAAVAIGLAVQTPPAALVLRSPFTSLADVGRLHYPWLPVGRLLLDRYLSHERITRLTAPLLVIAGTGDAIVPADLSRRLYDAAPQPKRLVEIPGADHNDPRLLDGREMIAEIVAFLREQGVLPE